MVRGGTNEMVLSKGGVGMACRPSKQQTTLFLFYFMVIKGILISMHLLIKVCCISISPETLKIFRCK
jgi:hypothetical protein